jgi:hypothetical protein
VVVVNVALTVTVVDGPGKVTVAVQVALGVSTDVGLTTLPTTTAANRKACIKLAAPGILGKAMIITCDWRANEQKASNDQAVLC